GAAAAGDRLGDIAVAALDLAALALHVDAVGILVVDGEVIEDVAELGAGADLAAAQADAADGMAVAQGPVDDVEVVDVLLADVVARQPGEVEPVAHLPFDIG